MQASELALERCDDDGQWDDIVRSSPQGTAFSTSAFLRGLGVGYERWVVRHGGQNLLAALLLVDGGVPLRAPYPMSLYHGLMLDRSVSDLPTHTRVKRTLMLVDFLIGRLSEVHDTLSFCLHHTFTDVRSLLWFNYHEPSAGMFHIDVRYSALLDLAQLDDLDGYLRAVRDARRAEYQRARSAGYTVETRPEVETVERLHRLTFERQGEEQGAVERHVIRSVGSAMVDAGTGEHLACVAPSGEAVSSTVFLRDELYAYYWIGATDPSHRRHGVGTFTLLESMRRARAAGARTLDLVGVNSPDRGDYKTSFNATPVPFFVATWRRGTV